MLTDPTEYLQAELQRLDILLHRQILRLRATYQLSLDEFRGLYISDQQVDNLINQISIQDKSVPGIDELTQKAEALRKVNSETAIDNFPFQQLASEFSLSQFEQDVLLLALAPEINLKYETLYAYLNNDVSRKWPSYDLALSLFSSSRREMISNRTYLGPHATLFRSGLLQPIQQSQDRPTWLTGGFSLKQSVAQHLLGHKSIDPRLLPFVTETISSMEFDSLPLSADLRKSLERAVHLFGNQDNHPGRLLIFEGRYGSGRVHAAEALCAASGIPLLSIDIEALRASSEPVPKITAALGLQQRLRPSGIYVKGMHAMLNSENRALPEAHQLVKELAKMRGPVILSIEEESPWHELTRGIQCLLFRFPDPDYNERLRLWSEYAAVNGSEVPQETQQALADRFVLTSGQIGDAVSDAYETWRLSGNGASSGSIDPELLFKAARAQSDRNLGKLATKVKAMHTWNDLVLPGTTLQRVKEIAAAIRNRNVVYSEWGFEKRISYGKGLKILFSGASGTGKTMTAGVIARDLGLDLYMIDLSGIVSKYIGETEKNLDRIFRAAHCSNAILFFDEADALFGKRSEVKDSHDRYANIEISYLLQKMEEHEGVVILASNLSGNIDKAFSRRMHYVIEFPIPDEEHREHLWRGMFPEEVPLGEDVDFPFLAKQFQLSGGDIRNVALEAAFLAAQDGQVVTMKELTKAMARQLIKQGKVPSATEFKQYHSLIH